MDNLISIIVPIYNVEKYLKRCIDSIINQTYKNLEIILIDDGSSDCSLQICNNYAIKDNRIKVIHQKNYGVSVARNNGLKYASGKYLMFIDSDDYLPYNAVEILINNSSKNSLLIGSYTTIRKKIKVKCIQYKSNVYQNKEILDCFPEIDTMMNTLWAKLYDLELIKKFNLKFNTNLCIGEDHCFNLQYLKHISSIIILNKNIYFYSLGGFLSTTKYNENQDDMYLNLINEYSNFNNTSWLEQKKIKIFFDVINHYLICLPYKDAYLKIKLVYNKFSKIIDINNSCDKNYKAYLCLINSDFDVFFKKYISKNMLFLIYKKIIRQIRIKNCI